MKTRSALMTAVVLAGVAFARLSLAAEYGVFVDGGYSPGSRDTEMDRLVDRRIDEAKRVFDSRHNDSEDQSYRADTKAGLQAALGAINCKCGDTLTIVMMGHGSNKSFKFTKEDKSVSAKQLRELLGGATAECCCKIHVVIFACHSGSFINELFKDPHVQSVYTSCRGNEVSQSYQDWEDGQFVDRGDWMNGFNEDYAAADAAASEADALEEASKSAEEKMRTAGTAAQHPQGWRRGNLPVLAHVENVRKSGGQIVRLQLHFYDPEFMRCTTEWVDVPAGSAPADLARCNWVRFTGVFGAPDDRNPIGVSGEVSRAEAPTERVLAHVVGVNRSAGTVSVHTVEPKWMYCVTRTMKVEPPGQIASSIQNCKWIEQDVRVDDPDGGISTSGDVTPKPGQVFRAKFHVEGSRNYDSGTTGSHVLEPPFLRCRRPTIQLPASERGELENLRVCDNIWADYNMDMTAEGFAPVSNAAKCTNLGSPTHYYGHDAGIDAVLEPGTSTVIRQPFNPRIVVRNMGQQPAYSLTIYCTIQLNGVDAFTSVQPAGAMDPGSGATITFPQWAPQQTGLCTVSFSLMPSDANMRNNEISITTSVASPETWPIKGDANMDCRVNVLDLIFIRNRLNQDVTSGDNWQADITGDGRINVLDLIKTRNMLQSDCQTALPQTLEFKWSGTAMAELPPDVGGGTCDVTMSGFSTWDFQPSSVTGQAALSLVGFSGSVSGVELYIDANGDGVPEPVHTGDFIFDIHDVVRESSTGTLNVQTWEFTNQTVVVPRAPELEAMGIDAFPEPIVITDTGTLNLRTGKLEVSGSFSITSGPLASTSAFFSKGGGGTTTKKLASNQWWVDQRLSFAFLQLKNLAGVPDGKVKVKAVVKINGKEKTIEGEVEVSGGKTTTGLKIAGSGDMVDVVSVEITY